MSNTSKYPPQKSSVQPGKCAICKGSINRDKIRWETDGSLTLFNLDGTPHACPTNPVNAVSLATAPVEMTDEEKALREMLRTDTLMPGTGNSKVDAIREWFSGKGMKYKTLTPHVLALDLMLSLATVLHTQDPPDKRIFTLGTFMDKLNQDYIDLAPTWRGKIRDEFRDIMKGVVEEEDQMKERLSSAILRHS
jgi:hypothetical protein